MNALTLREPDNKLLKAHLALFDHIRTNVRETEKWVDAALHDNKMLPILKSLPGVGKILGALIACRALRQSPSERAPQAYWGTAIGLPVQQCVEDLLRDFRRDIEALK